MDLGNYVFNLETEKIELHFAKADYLALSDEQKRKIKSNFGWSNKGGCWVSRCKEPNLYHARKVAESLGFAGEERVGERLGYGEKLEAQKERAEARAERYEERAEKAEKRGEALQSELKSFSGDIAFFTQPNINSSAGRAFRNYRERLFARYDKGFGEYKKSEYYQSRAVVALDTAAMSKLNDKGYLMRQIKDCIKEIKAREGHIIRYEENLYRIEQGETLKRYDKSIITEQDLQKAIERELELVNKAMDKQAFMEDKLAELGGVAFSKENIAVGYIVRIVGQGVAEVVSVGPQNIQYKTAHGFVLTAAYAEIIEVLKATKVVKPPHPFKVGETYEIKRYDLCERFSDPTPIHTYKIIKKTDVSVTIQNQTIPGEKTQTLRPSQSKFNPDNWDLTIRGKWFQKTSIKEVN